MTKARESGRRVWASILGPLVVLALAAPAGAAPSGHLDHEFGHGGKLTIPTKLLGPRVKGLLWPNREALATELLPAGKGSFLLAHRDRIFRFEKDGSLDPKFGQGGYVTITPPSGQLLTPNDVAIDVNGRILIAAEAQDANSQPEKAPGLGENPFDLHGPPLSRAAVLRLLPDGRPDPSFGSGGIVESTVNAPPPSFEGRSYATPSVQGLAISSDAQGRPILAGSFVTETRNCYPYTFLHFATKSFVARFGPGGALESVASDPTATGTGAGIALRAAGAERSLFQRFETNPCWRGEPKGDASTIALLDPAGAVEPSFTPATVISFGTPVIARDGRGRVLVAGEKEATAGGGQMQFAMRLRANGSLDTGFGRGGELPLLGTGELGQIAVDANNRPLLPRGLEAGGGLAINRLTAGGKLDGRFGKRGFVAIPFSAAASGSASAVMVDGAGRIVVAGSLARPGAAESEEFIGLARYQP